MKKKLLFSSIALLSCLAVLFGSLVIIPKAAHAAPAHHNTKSAAPIISISPTTLDMMNDCPQIDTIDGESYRACIVTLTIPGSKNSTFTTSFNAQDCYGPCQPFYDMALLPGGGAAYSGPQGTRIVILVPNQNGHEIIHANIFFYGPANKVKLHLDAINECC